MTMYCLILFQKGARPSYVLQYELLGFRGALYEPRIKMMGEPGVHKPLNPNVFMIDLVFSVPSRFAAPLKHRKRSILHS